MSLPETRPSLLTEQERERQLQKRLDEEKPRIAARVRALDEEIAEFQQALESLP